jgi:hypothetical protein
MKARGFDAAHHHQKPLLPLGDLRRAWRPSVCGQLKRRTNPVGMRGLRRKPIESADIVFSGKRSSTESRSDRRRELPFKIQTGFQL